MTRQELLRLRPGSFVRVIKKPWGVWGDTLYGKVFEVSEIAPKGGFEEGVVSPAAICPIPSHLAVGRYKTARNFCFTPSDIEIA